ncbi:MAG TPA: M23 family metallopeptidase [Mobilitalea sp.]|nr:M23 family metallopeptidase [Mobilitalea sp.]
MHFVLKARHIILCELIIILIFCSIILKQGYEQDTTTYATMYDTEKNYIKWVSFDVTCSAMEDAYDYDVKSQAEEVKINWIELLAYLGCKYGGDFSKYKSKNMADLVEKLKSKEATINSLTEGMKYYDYYYEAYSAVLGGMVGDYKIEVADASAPGGKRWEEKYGLKVFLPIAKNYPYSHFDDFGVSRSYGFKRKHLGHDMMGQVGTPIIAVESGYVEALGWNQYGGWRIGIRSFDGKRYYYYAHLRKNFPYSKCLEVGSIVQAGDVIGYLGRTGYSSSENANNIRTPHLHFGLQLIFDESQKESNNEIWIDCYELVQFLYKNRCETVKNEETKEYTRVYQFIDPIAEHYINHKMYKYDDNEFNIHIYE